ncbi:MAG: TRAP transporter small permease subunit [Bacteroidetes bacterium]|nr:MAG: TRAP transporter small permease subunit [Bacteroidota bacterium]
MKKTSKHRAGSRLARGISRLLKVATLLSSAAFMGMVVLQIVARFAFTQAPSWTEEAARIFFIFTISFAAGLAAKSKYYVAMDLLYNRLSPRMQNWLDLLNNLLVLLLFGLMLVYSIDFIRLGMVETSPSMRVPMAIPFASMFIMALFILYYVLLDTLRALKSLRS